MKKIIVAILGISLFFLSCSESKLDKSTQVSDSNKSRKLIVGFAQVGAESEWRIANTRSIKETAEKENIELLFSDSLQKQENQIKAIKSFISQKVDCISFSPITDSGWNDVLSEVKKANIPVVIVDRKANVDNTMFNAFVGSNFYEEGKKAAIEMGLLLSGKGNICELQGTIGSDPAIQRKKGFEDEISKNYPEIKIIRSESGDFFRQKGKEIMKKFLDEEKTKIDAIFSHNDEMSLGAVEEIESRGIIPGKDIKIVSVDAVSKEILEKIKEGKVNASAECNPFLGPILFKTIKEIIDNKKVERFIYSKEGIINQNNVIDQMKLFKYIE